ncbi:MAG TPA: LamG domain-containing protein [Polyangiaceae bacterium]|nr:LamG domain-containing protein [Polyangiaceae bacterium]
MFRGALSLSFLLLSGCGDALRLEVVFDDCPNDVEKIYPGECGCGIAEERCVPLKDALVHRYAFNGRGPVAVDDVGGADGAILNTELSGLGQLYLDRSAELEQYVELPNGIISALDSATFETWVTWETPPTEPKPFWERIFDFGVSTLGEEQRESGKSYLFLAPGQPGTTPKLPRAAFRDLNTDGEVIIDALDATPSNAMFNMAVVVDAPARELVLFMNGVEQGRTQLTEPLSAIEDVNNWLGRSQFVVDTRFGGSFHEFRIYDRALSQLQLIDSVALGPSPAFLEPKSADHDGSGAP